MIGVILWRDIRDGKAVIWCEDQGDLAYLDRLEDVLDQNAVLDVGDVVRFDLMIRRNLRLARNVTRLLDNWGSTLGDVLQRIPGDPDAFEVRSGAEVVPFHLGQNTDQKLPEDADNRRHG